MSNISRDAVTRNHPLLDENANLPIADSPTPESSLDTSLRRDRGGIMTNTMTKRSRALVFNQGEGDDPPSKRAVTNARDQVQHTSHDKSHGSAPRGYSCCSSDSLQRCVDGCTRGVSRTRDDVGAMEVEAGTGRTPTDRDIETVDRARRKGGSESGQGGSRCPSTGSQNMRRRGSSDKPHSSVHPSRDGVSDSIQTNTRSHTGGWELGDLQAMESRIRYLTNQDKSCDGSTRREQVLEDNVRANKFYSDKGKNTGISVVSSNGESIGSGESESEESTQCVSLPGFSDGADQRPKGRKFVQDLTIDPAPPTTGASLDMPTSTVSINSATSLSNTSITVPEPGGRTVGRGGGSWTGGVGQTKVGAGGSGKVEVLPNIGMGTSSAELELLRAQIHLLKDQVAQRDRQLEAKADSSYIPIAPAPSKAATIASTPAPSTAVRNSPSSSAAMDPAGTLHPWNSSSSLSSAKDSIRSSHPSSPGGTSSHGMVKGSEDGRAANSGGGGNTNDRGGRGGSQESEIRDSYSGQQQAPPGWLMQGQNQQQRLLSTAQAEGIRMHRDLQLHQLQQQQHQHQQLMQRRQERQSQRQREEALRQQHQQKWMEIGRGQTEQEVRKHLHQQQIHPAQPHHEHQHHQHHHLPHQHQQHLEHQQHIEQHQLLEQHQHLEHQHLAAASHVPGQYAIQGHVPGQTQHMSLDQQPLPPGHLQHHQNGLVAATAAQNAAIALSACQARLERAMKALRTVYAKAGEEVNGSRCIIESLKVELKAARKEIKTLKAKAVAKSKEDEAAAAAAAVGASSASSPVANTKGDNGNIEAAINKEQGTQKQKTSCNAKEYKQEQASNCAGNVGGNSTNVKEEGKASVTGVNPSLLMAANFELSELEGEVKGPKGIATVEDRREAVHFKALLEASTRRYAELDREVARLSETLKTKTKETEASRREVTSLSSALEGMARQLEKKDVEMERLETELHKKEVALSIATDLLTGEIPLQEGAGVAAVRAKTPSSISLPSSATGVAAPSYASMQTSSGHQTTPSSSGSTSGFK
ncbi:unnamed protein product [Choristocarpus tenellus]